MHVLLLIQKNKLKKLFISGIKAGMIFIALCFLSSGCMKTTCCEKQLKVGFDIDDTLLFSTPAFRVGFNSDVKKFSPEFWKIVNSSDSENSKIKNSTKNILLDHRNQGDIIYAITSRHPFGTAPVKKFINKTFGIPEENIYFEIEGKSSRMKMLDLDIFYGDSDSDISDSIEAGVKPYRILRARESSYKKKYNPGKYGEEIIEGSEW